MNAAQMAEALKAALEEKGKKQKVPKEPNEPSESAVKPKAKAKGKAKADDVKKDSHFGSSILKPPPYLGTQKRAPIYYLFLFRQVEGESGQG